MDFPARTLIGMVHLPPLPGSAGHQMSMDRIIRRAVDDSRALADAGFDAIIVENFGDAPFTAESLPSASLAAMAVAADHVRRAVSLPLGINALRNDARAAVVVELTLDLLIIVGM